MPLCDALSIVSELLKRIQTLVFNVSNACVAEAVLGPTVIKFMNRRPGSHTFHVKSHEIPARFGNALQCSGWDGSYNPKAFTRSCNALAIPCHVAGGRNTMN